MNVKIKKLHPDAIVPSYSRPGDAGLDLTATSMNETDMYIEYGTSLAVSIPSGFFGLIAPRSSLSNYHLTLSNHLGIIDSNYRGEIKFRFKKTNPYPYAECKVYTVGERVGQLLILPIPEIQFEEVTELDETVRGANGYGSSGK